MFKNFLKVSIRNFRKNKTNTFINITGLSLGITCSLIIFLIINFEQGFNRFNNDYENIYRVVSERYEYGKTVNTSGIPYPLPVALKNDFSQIKYITFVDANSFEPLITIRHEDGRISKFQEERIAAFVNPDYFKIFTYEWLQGDKNSALTKPGTAVISESLAKKYFGSSNAVGQIININNEQEIEIAGVVKDPPLNSDLNFQMLIEIESSKRITDNWGSISSAVQCFLKLKENVNKAAFDNELKAFVKKYRPRDSEEKIKLYLQPLDEIHLDDKFENFESSSVTKEFLWALGCIGVFLIVMASINYINLNTAVAVNRTKEVGIRKVLGGKRIHIVFNFLTETLIIVFFSIILSLALTEALLDKLEGILGYQLSLSLFDPWILTGFLLSLFIFVCLSAGVYPSIYLSGLKSLAVVRSRVSTSDQNSFLRKSLVVAQFVIAHAIIIGTLIVISQVDYFRGKDLGFNKEAIVEVSLPLNNPTNLDNFRDGLNRIPGVKTFTFSSTGAASTNLWTGNFVFNNGKTLIEDRTEVKIADKNYFQTYGISIIAGEGLTESDTVTRFVINESFARTMGLGNDYASAPGKIIKIWGDEAPIAGVIKDFNSQTLHSKIMPMAIASNREYYFRAGIKINLADAKATISEIEKAWSNAYPEFVFDYSFLDDRIEEFYEREIRTSTILNVFSFIAIFIGCMGLFGLASHTIANKTKEIGIRKVLGATVASILALITKEFIKLIIIGFVISVPLAYFLMNKWLDEFAYKISIGPWVFIIAILFTLGITLLTVGYKSLRAATANPVNSLKYE